MDAAASARSLTAAGWQARSSPGMPNTLSGLPQAGYLLLASPDGHQLDAQFMQDAAAAQAEADDVTTKDPAFLPVVIANVMVFSHPDGHAQVDEADRASLASLLVPTGT